jgi:hypothetical protein
MRVIFGKFYAEASCLHADRRVALRIESRWPPKNLGCDLVLLESNTGVVERMLGQIAEEFAQGLGGAETMTINKFIYLLEALLPAQRECVRHSHITGT